MFRRIKKIAVLGSGVMGSRIACHFANIGVQVVLLDIIPRELNEKEKAMSLTLEDKAVRNRIVNDALQFALKSNPSPIYSRSFVNRITTGNFEDDLGKIADCDWIIEAVVERIDIKQQVFQNVEKHRKQGTIISSNTSGIPMQMMLEGRSEDFQKHFCGTHFFNPPRYLKLLEIIPTLKTDPAIVDFLMEYGSRNLGKTTVLCKDTPAFIANRVGVYSIMSLFHLVKEMDLSVEEVDKLTGPVLGRPKSATFRTCDVVGIDTLVHVANGVRENCPKDEAKEVFEVPDYISSMLEKGWLGSKSGQGFYKKVKDDKGNSEILSLNLDSLDYEGKQKVSFDTLAQARSVEDLSARLRLLYNGTDKAGEFYRKSFMGLFQYVSNRIPEIADEIYKIDDAMKAGFGWEQGPFEAWDVLGVKAVVKQMEEAGRKPAAWIYKMLEENDHFYRIADGRKKYYDIRTNAYQPIPGTEELLSLEVLRASNKVWGNKGTTITDLGDGVINLEFHTKMNTIGQEVIEGINKAIDLAEKEYKALIISNEGANFSAGANVGMIFMMAVEQDYDELNFAVKAFQDTMMRVRYSSIPVIVAPHGLTLGGGCEMSLHADKVIAHAETYMGLVEFGVGVIPGGGGTKEFALRVSDAFEEGDIRTNTLRNRFLTIGQAKVSTSAHEAFELGYLREGIDEVIVSRAHQLSYAKQAALDLVSKGYSKPVPRKNIKVLGNEGLGIVYAGANSMRAGNYISEHDQLISEKLGFVMCGGDLSGMTEVSEQYLLDMERKAFVELCQKKKTLERLESIIKTGKVLRN